MQVTLIAITQYLGSGSAAGDAPYGTEALIEHAGRICYRGAAKGSPAATGRFVQRRIKAGHVSIIEHASASFLIERISRACSHQLVRHRIASYSQESQRYVDMSNPDFVIPDAIQEDEAALEIFRKATRTLSDAYRGLLSMNIRKEDARFLLPNATATRLVMTANFRELLHLFRLRISPHAQWEIRHVAARMLELVYPHAPHVFGSVREELSSEFPEFFPSIGPAMQDALFTYALQTPDNALRDDLLELLVEREWCKAESESGE